MAHRRANDQLFVNGSAMAATSALGNNGGIREAHDSQEESGSGDEDHKEA